MRHEPPDLLIALGPVVVAAILAACGPAPTNGPPADDAVESPAASGRGTPGAVATLDPTLEAVYADFEPPLKGSADAAVVVYVFSDYTCPYCRQTAIDVLPVIEREMVPGGDVALAFVDFPLASHGYPTYVSHESAHCAAEQGRYWDMHDALFDAQSQLAALDPQDEDASVRAVLAIGRGIGLEAADLEACVTSGRYRTLVAAMAQKAQDSGIVTAPSLLLQSEAHTDLVVGAITVDGLRTAIRTLLRAATEEAPPRR